MIHTSQNIPCPTDLNFLYETNYIRRAGIIPFSIRNGLVYLLLGYSKEINPVWADLGGRAEKNETTIETAIREYTEESRNVLPLDLSRTSKILITSKNEKPDQAILFVETEFNSEINKIFEKTSPKNKYEDEMYLLQWIPYHTFLIMSELSDSLKSVQELLFFID